LQNLQTKLYIGGELTDGLAGRTIDVINPADGTVLATVSEAGAEDIDRAVAAAGRAFPRWAATPAADRGRLLLRLADAIEGHAAELARLESLDTGHPIRDTTVLDVPRTAAAFRYFGGIADKHQGAVIPVEQGFLNYVVPEPIGVAGSIVPWNFPLMFSSWKLGPALAAGNTTVLKASELTPMTSLRLAELIAEAGFPPGVVNIVPGYGHVAGARLAEHPDVGKVSFTGSTETGRRIVTASAGNLKRLQLELGGKGANIVFPDADIPAAVRGSAFAIFHNQGQACIAGSRLLLHEAIAAEFLDVFIATARRIRIGHPLEKSTQLGPLTSAMHRDRVTGYLKSAADGGATVLAGGAAPDAPDLADGYYLQPTVVRAEPDSQICQDEVFGPVVTVSTFSTDEQAIAIANGTEYGLGGGLWTADLSRAHRVAAAMRSGMIWVNCYKRVNPGSPFGGTGSSGYGREMGFAAMAEYTTQKSVWINVDATLPDWYAP
jgi:acyl-CoA reductase-like NAD-dependent aldehyde dehydrogenase